MKKFVLLLISVLLISLCLVPMLSACNSDGTIGGSTATEKLIVYNWEDYISTDNLDNFTAYYKEKTGRNLEVVYTTFDTNETMLTKVLKKDANVDLICPSEYAVEKLMRAGALLNIKNLETELAPQLTEYGVTLENSKNNIEPKITEAIQNTFGAMSVGDKTLNMNDYIVPYMWGTLGIMYNKNVVTEADLNAGWGMLWNRANNPKLENKILMKDSIRDAYVAGVMYLKEYDMLPEKYKTYSIVQLINCTETELLKEVEKVLTEQRSHISGYEVDFGKDDMLNEIVYADLAWSGDALWAISESYNKETDSYLLDYFVPEIGSNIWYDGWVIPTTVKNKLAATMFIDYMSMPQSAIMNSDEIGYTSAVAKEKMKSDAEVITYLTDAEYDIDEFFDDIRRYPNLEDASIMSKMGVMSDYGAHNEVVVQMWERVKAGGTIPWELIWSLIAILTLCSVVAIAYFSKEWFKRRPRKIKIQKIA